MNVYVTSRTYWTFNLYHIVLFRKFRSESLLENSSKTYIEQIQATVKGEIDHESDHVPAKHDYRSCFRSDSGPQHLRLAITPPATID